MREEAALVPDPLAREQPGQLTDLAAAIPRDHHMVSSWRPVRDAAGCRMVLDVHGQRRPTRSHDLQVVVVLAWPQPHLHTGNGRERVPEAHLGDAGDHHTNRHTAKRTH